MTPGAPQSGYLLQSYRRDSDEVPHSYLHPCLSGVRGIIFDMDGVLVLSSGIHEEAFLEVLSPLGLSFHYPQYAGMRTGDAIIAIARAGGSQLDPADVDRLAASKTRAALRRLSHGAPLAPAVREVLETLHMDYPLALATSASESTMRAVIDANELRQYFRCLLSSKDCAAAKPAPEIYLRAAECLGLHPSECLVVEDSAAGIAAAVAAGAKCVGVAGTLSSAELAEHGVNAVVTSLLELVAGPA